MHAWKKISLKKYDRVLCFSDIHGSLPLLIKALDELQYQEEKDAIVFVGDYLEKGLYPIETLRFLFDLKSKPNVFFTFGNCEHLAIKYFWKKNLSLFKKAKDKEGTLVHAMIKDYMQHHAPIKEDGLFQQTLKKEYQVYLDFLSHLPLVLESEDYLFVHAALYEEERMKQTPYRYATTHKYFLNDAVKYSKIVVCGHFPTTIYRTDQMDNGIIFEKEKNILSMDGGCVVQEGGQLNCVVLKDKSISAYPIMNYPLVKVTKDDSGSQRTSGICWPNYDYQIIEKGPDFTKVKCCTGVITWIKNEWMREEKGKCFAYDDCPSEILMVKKGDILSLINETGSNYSLVKKGSHLGWCKKTNYERVK
jgi:protein phosphatase